MTNFAEKSLVIYGNGLSAWLSAAVLKYSLPDNWLITIVDDDAVPNAAELFPLADTISPTVEPLLPQLRIVPATLLQSGGSFSFGTAYRGLSARDKDFFSPYSELGAALGPVTFQSLIQKLRQAGKPVRFSDFSVAALAAQTNRFEIPSSDPRSPQSTCSWGAHYDVPAYTAILKIIATKMGVVHLQDRLASLERVEQNISTLILESGRFARADLVLDCSGQHRLLARNMQSDSDSVNWEDWSGYFPLDKTVFAELADSEAPEPFSSFYIHDRGWVKHIPLIGKRVLQHSYNSERMSFEEATKMVLQAFPRCRVSQEVKQKFGRLLQPWQGNCVAIGGSAAAIDPLGSSNLQLLYYSLNLLLQLFPADSDDQILPAEYNRRFLEFTGSARDFSLAHYALNGRKEGVWSPSRNMRIPESLQYKIDLYKNIGKIALYDSEAVSEARWLSLFDELGLIPCHSNIQAEAVSHQQIERHLNTIRSAMLNTVKQMPLHGDYLSRLKIQLQQQART